MTKYFWQDWQDFGNPRWTLYKRDRSGVLFELECLISLSSYRLDDDTTADIQWVWGRCPAWQRVEDAFELSFEEAVEKLKDEPEALQALLRDI